MSKWLEKQRERERQDYLSSLESARLSVDPEPEIPLPDAPPARPSRKYTWVEGDVIWEVARRLGVPASELLEHNDIEDASEIQPGTVLHSPYKRFDEQPVIWYEVYDQPRMMHVSKADGTRKFMFGNVKTWLDLKKTGPTVKENTVIEVVAAAHVPVGEDWAVYFMDTLALGDYVTTGKVSLTVGFNYNHLKDGIPIIPKVEESHPAMEEIAKDIEEMEQALEEQAEVVIEPTPEPIVEEPAETQAIQVVEAEIPVQPEPEYTLDDFGDTTTFVGPNSYKASYHSFTDGPKEYFYNDDIIVEELDGRRLNKVRTKGEPVSIAGMFVKDNVIYGRPAGAVDSGLWFGIPMDKIGVAEEIESEEDNSLFTDDTTLLERHMMGQRLTMGENAFVLFSKYVSAIKRLVIKLNKKGDRNG